jgi:hypothetical protein
MKIAKSRFRCLHTLLKKFSQCYLILGPFKNKLGNNNNNSNNNDDDDDDNNNNNNNNNNRYNCPRGVRRVLFSTALTLGSWARIPLKAWMYVRVFLCCAVLRRQRPCDGPIPHPRSPTKCSE